MNDYSEIILSHYKKVAEEDGALECSTMKDQYIRKSETSYIEKFVANYISFSIKKQTDITIADIGCGNGYTLSRLSQLFPKVNFIGYEYTPELRSIAAARFKDVANVEIKEVDIRATFPIDEMHDLCYTQRVIINLLNENDQRNAVKNVIDSVATGGTVLFIESLQSGQDMLNEARAEFNLPPIKSAYHNLLLTDSFFKWTEELETYCVQGLENNFLSSYYYITRVLHPLLLGNIPFQKNSHFVRYMAANITENFGNFSPVQAHSFSK